MNPFEPRCHHFMKFHIVAVLVGFSSLGMTQAWAEEPVDVAPVADSPVTIPTPDALSPQEIQDSPVPDEPSASAEDMQNRLNSLQQRLDKVSDMDLDPILLLLPNLSSNVPNAYGASEGVAAIGLGYQNRIRYNSHRQDGTAGVVVGLSDPRKLGVDIQASVLDLSRPAHNGALGFKLHRQLSDDYAVAFGGENALVSSATDSGSSYYAVISKKLRLAESSKDPFSRVYLSLGIGNGRFRSERDIFSDTGNVNVFGSAAVNVNRAAMAFAEWNGQSLNVGASVVPIRTQPLVLTLALADVAGTAHNGARFTAGLSYVFTR